MCGMRDQVSVDLSRTPREPGGVAQARQGVAVLQRSGGADLAGWAGETRNLVFETIGFSAALGVSK